MTARSKTYWNGKLITGYQITQADWVDIIDSIGIYRPATEPVLAGSDLTIDMADLAEAIFEPKANGARTITIPFNILFSNFASAQLIVIRLALTGTIAIQFPDGSGGQPNIKCSNEGAGTWDQSNKILTIEAGTSEVYELSLLRDVQSILFDLSVGGGPAI